MPEVAAANRRRALLVVAAVGAAVGIVVLLLLTTLGAPLIGLLLALASGAGVTAWLWRGADATVLRLVDGVAAEPQREARLHNLVEGLRIAGGVAKPDLYVVESDGLNALAVGRDPRNAALVVTSGLLRSLSRLELEGVVAHELTRIKANRMAVGTAVVPLLRLGLKPALQAVPREDAVADVDGVALTRYPPGLISALEKLRDQGTVVAGAAEETAHLWLAAPSPDATHAPLDVRIEALREL